MNRLTEIRLQYLTGDLGGKAKTHEYAKAIIDKL